MKIKSQLILHFFRAMSLHSSSDQSLEDGDTRATESFRLFVPFVNEVAALYVLDFVQQLLMSLRMPF